MALTVKHAFTNPIADEPGFTGTKPSDWNADHVVTGGGAAPPLNAVQFNLPLGTLDGSAGMTYNPYPGFTLAQIGGVDPGGLPLFGAGLGTGLQIGGEAINGVFPTGWFPGPALGGHLAVGNTAMVDMGRYAPGDVNEDSGFVPGPIVINVNEIFTGDIGITGGSNTPVGIAIGLNSRNTGTNPGGITALAIGSNVASDSTGPFDNNFGIVIDNQYLGQGNVGELRGIVNNPTMISDGISAHLGTMSGEIVYMNMYNQAGTTNLLIDKMGSFESFQSYIYIVNQGIGVLSTEVTNAYGLLINTPIVGGSASPLGATTITNNYGVYIQDQTAAAINATVGGGYAITNTIAENFHSAGAASTNVIEGKFNFGTASNASPGNGDLWYDNTHFYFRHGSTSTDLLAGGGSPGGANTDVQFNNSSAFGGDGAFTYAGSGAVTIGAAGTGTGIINFKGTTSGTTTLSVADAAYTGTIKLPAIAPTNGYVVSTDGSGNWTYITPPGSSGSLVINTTTITGGTTKHVVYDNAGTVGEAANFTIESGNPNVTSGNAYLYNGMQVIIAQTALANFYEGGAGNLTGTGQQNCGTGPSCLAALTTGNNNMGLGDGALQDNTTGNNNVAIGVGALFINISGDGNMAIGQGAMSNSTTAGSNVAIGVAALVNSNGTGNIAIGPNSQQNATGDNNISVGASSGAALGGLQNICMGVNTLGSEASGNFNIIIGHQAFPSENGGSNNTMVGHGCGFFATSCSDNTGIGYEALLDITSGALNTCIGNTAGGGLQTGSYNTIIGVLGGLGSSLNNNVILADGQSNIVFQYDPTNGIYLLNNATFLVRALTTLTGGATGNVPTLTAGPVTGNPTKWIAIDDNGVTRYIPAW